VLISELKSLCLNIELLQKAEEEEDEDILDEIEDFTATEVIDENLVQQADTAATPEEPSEKIEEEVTA
jgi:hypothetical protein